MRIPNAKDGMHTPRQLTLWDLLEPIARRLRPRRPDLPSSASGPERSAGPPAAPARSRRGRPDNARPRASPARRDGRTPPPRPSAAERYDALVRDMLARYDIRVRRWRRSMTGVAWTVRYRDGAIRRLIEAPRPRSPMSAAIFLHEVGHHAIGFDVYKPRCREEYYAWKWSLEQMQAHGIDVTESVRRRMHNSLNYAIDKARRRGLKSVPDELVAYLHRLPSKARAR